MCDAIAAYLAALLLFYAVACATWVPVRAYIDWKSNRECAQQHNVFRCERIEIWRPVPTKQPEGRK